MFKKVQKQLTILYTVLTGSILIILLAFISYRNISIREQQQETDFHNLWFSVSSRLQSYSFISDAYLAQMEVTNQAVIYIEENSSPLFFSGAWTPPTERTAYKSGSHCGRTGRCGSHTPACLVLRQPDQPAPHPGPQRRLVLRACYGAAHSEGR